MDILKRIGGCILGAVEGWFLCLLFYKLNDATASNFAYIISSIIGGVIGFCLPIATVAIFIGLVYLITELGASRSNDRR